jgi:hypothetical protein
MGSQFRRIREGLKNYAKPLGEFHQLFDLLWISGTVNLECKFDLRQTNWSGSVYTKRSANVPVAFGNYLGTIEW